MKVKKSRNGDDYVFAIGLIPGRVVARRIVDEEGLTTHYDLEVTVKGKTERVHKVVPSEVDLKQIMEMQDLLTAAYEHIAWEYENHPFRF